MLRQALLVLLLFCSTLRADDWPQFQGKNRDSISSETGLSKSWPESGLPLLWTFSEAGTGYSSAAVAAGKAYLTGARGDQEFLICLDVTTGKELWSTAIGPKFDFDGNQWGAGPRATPTVAQGHIVALGGGGQLICVDAASGKASWKLHMQKDLGGEVNPIGGGPGTKPGEAKIGWGYCWSPLIDGSTLVCFPGGPQGAAVALELKTGKVVWRSAEFTKQASYASPIVAELSGVKQYVFLHNDGLTGVNAADGKVLWNWEKKYADVVIPTPILVDGMIYVSAGTNPSTCDLVEVTKTDGTLRAASLYKGKTQRVMKNAVGGSVIVHGNAYGYSDKIGWVCQEVASGKQRWAARQPLQAGSVIAVDGHLICYDEENRELALLEANPDEFKLLGKFMLPVESKFPTPGGRNWTPVSFADGRLIVREQEHLFCFKAK